MSTELPFEMEKLYPLQTFLQRKQLVELKENIVFDKLYTNNVLRDISNFSTNALIRQFGSLIFFRQVLQNNFNMKFTKMRFAIESSFGFIYHLTIQEGNKLVLSIMI